MSSQSHLYLGASYLQRRAEDRPLPDWAERARGDSSTQFIVMRGTAHLVWREPARPALLGAADEPIVSLPDSQLTLLGWFRGRRTVLAALPADHSFATPAGTYEELRPLLPQLAEEESHLLAYARALVVWRSRHRHCGLCGAPTTPRSAGHVLACTRSGCDGEFFPRIDPAIIVLVTDGDHALLGRQPSWPAGRYSALAGFVEAGESLEDAVAREVDEETGTQVVDVQYFASQPWPFPSSLMLGFHATARRGTVRLSGELEDARWFSRAEMQSAAAGLLPPPYTIARRLIDTWLGKRADTP